VDHEAFLPWEVRDDICHAHLWVLSFDRGTGLRLSDVCPWVTQAVSQDCIPFLLS
jgi:hypothetical protein